MTTTLAPTSPPKAVELCGTVDTVTYTDTESGYGVIKLRVDDGFKSLSFVKRTGICTIVGPISRMTPGERVQVWGSRVNDKRFGEQVRVDKFILMEPKGYTDMIRYLEKNVKQIGPKLAKKIVDTFGPNTFSVIDNTPERIREVEKIGEKRFEEICLAWKEQREFRHLLMFATSVGIGGAALDKIYKKYKQRAVEVIRKDPYRLSRDIWGIGFKKADEIARHLGIEELSPIRLRAAVEHVIDEKSKNIGDCFQYAAELLNNTVEFLNDPRNINHDTVKRAILDGIANKGLFADRNPLHSPDKPEGASDKIYTPALYQAEVEVAKALSRIAKSPMPASLQGEKLDAAIRTALSTLTFEPAQAQKQGIINCLSNKMSVLTGGPGVGKTTVTKAIVHGFEAAGISVRLMAPTGRAAKRMTEVVGREATTIHRVLFKFNKAVREGQATIEECLMGGVIVLDECSMIDIALMQWLLTYVHPSAILVCVGDKDQLPSVGPGAVLRDMIECKVIPCTHLTQVFRQAAGSAISLAAADINAGRIPNLTFFGRNHPVVDSDLYCVYKETPDEQAQVATWCATQLATRFGFDPKKDCQVLSPMHKGPCGVAAINAGLQPLLNPNPIKWVDRGQGLRWGVGDKMMQLRNNYDVGATNGEIGTIVDLELEDNHLRKVLVDFDGTVCEYTDGDWTDLMLANASTIHKVQGSEFPMIVLVLHTSHYIMLQRNLLYTGLTRGKKRVVLVVHPTALSQAIQNNKIARRNTLLAERIASEM